MRRIETLTAPDSTLSLTVPFAVEHIAVFNPTIYTLGWRFGGRDIPNDISSTDMYVSPGASATFPVIGTDFAAGFMEPSSPRQPAALSDKAKVMFVAQEQPPVFSSISAFNVPPEIEVPTVFYDSLVPAGSGFTTRYSYPFPQNRRSRLKGIHAYIGPTTSDRQIRLEVVLHEPVQQTELFLVRQFSRQTDEPDTETWRNMDLSVQPGWSLRVLASNSDTFARSVSVFAYIENEVYEQ